MAPAIMAAAKVFTAPGIVPIMGFAWLYLCALTKREAYKPEQHKRTEKSDQPMCHSIHPQGRLSGRPLSFGNVGAPVMSL
jgi:hypothetical protein